MDFMTADAAREFADRWLPAWTGNEPDRLLSFYTNDAFYRDPTVPDGIYGFSQLREYFVKLLRANPNWVWLHREGIPLKDGFLNKWTAHIPVGTEAVECSGVCTVQIRGGLIYRNEVYFDAHALMQAHNNHQPQSRGA